MRFLFGFIIGLAVGYALATAFSQSGASGLLKDLMGHAGGDE